MLGAIFTILFIVMVLQAGIYWNTKPQEEYEVIVVNTTMEVQPLIDAGYFTLEKEGYFIIEEDEVYPRVRPCPICEAIHSGNLTLTSWDETLPFDNFTIITKELYNKGIFKWIKQ